MRKRAMVVVAAALLAAIPATSATAAKEPGCGGPWTGSAECAFVYDGGGLSVTGSFRSNMPTGACENYAFETW